MSLDGQFEATSGDRSGSADLSAECFSKNAVHPEHDLNKPEAKASAEGDRTGRPTVAELDAKHRSIIDKSDHEASAAEHAFAGLDQKTQTTLKQKLVPAMNDVVVASKQVEFKDRDKVDLAIRHVVDANDRETLNSDQIKARVTKELASCTDTDRKALEEAGFADKLERVIVVKRALRQEGVSEDAMVICENRAIAIDNQIAAHMDYVHDLQHYGYNEEANKQLALLNRLVPDDPIYREFHQTTLAAMLQNNDIVLRSEHIASAAKNLLAGLPEEARRKVGAEFDAYFYDPTNLPMVISGYRAVASFVNGWRIKDTGSSVNWG